MIEPTPTWPNWYNFLLVVWMIRSKVGTECKLDLITIFIYLAIPMVFRNLADLLLSLSDYTSRLLLLRVVVSSCIACKHFVDTHNVCPSWKCTSSSLNLYFCFRAFWIFPHFPATYVRIPIVPPIDKTNSLFA